MPPDFDRTGFTTLVRTAAEQALRDLQRRIANERLYTFGLYTNGRGTYVIPTANTEEALARTAHAASVSDGLPFELHRQSLRWSPCDWEYHEFGGETAFTAVGAFLQSGWSDDHATFHYDAEAIYACCIDALMQLRRDGWFDAMPGEPQIVLNLYMGDQSDEERLQWASLLNSPECCEQLQREFEQGCLAFRRLIDMTPRKGKRDQTPGQ